MENSEKYKGKIQNHNDLFMIFMLDDCIPEAPTLLLTPILTYNPKFMSALYMSKLSLMAFMTVMT